MEWKILFVLTNNFVPLVDVIGAREQHSTSDHLAHDATHGPNVHVLLVPHPQYDLRRPVVPRDHIRGHHEGRARRPREAKVQNFQCTVRLDHDIAGLQILRGKLV